MLQSVKRDNDYLLVNGNLEITDGYNISSGTDPTLQYLSAGTVEIKGDFTTKDVKTWGSWGSALSSYYETGTHKTILSGDELQKVSLDSNGYEQLVGLVLENTNVYLSSLPSTTLLQDTVVTYESNSNYEVNIRDTLDLNGHYLMCLGTINCQKLVSNGGSVTTGETLRVSNIDDIGGDCTITGNLYVVAQLTFHSSNITVNGNTTIGVTTTIYWLTAI